MSESRSASPIVYSEKLRAPWWMWIVVIALSAAVGLALSPSDMLLFTVLALVAAVIGSVLLIASAPSITVTDTTLSVGRAQIERRWLGEITGHVGDDARYERGRGLNGLAFMCFRGWVDPVMKAEITDPNDQTPYWLFSTRHPEALAKALGGTVVMPTAEQYGPITEESQPSALSREENA